MAATVKDVTQRFHLQRVKGEAWKIRDAKTGRVFERPNYTTHELTDLCCWLNNERERRYPEHPALKSDMLRG